MPVRKIKAHQVWVDKEGFMWAVYAGSLDPDLTNLVRLNDREVQVVSDNKLRTEFEYIGTLNSNAF